MMKYLFLAILTTSLVFGQNVDFLPNPKYPKLFKTLSTPITDTDPEWVKKMYSSNPNFFEITSLYDEYYNTHFFEKNTHTQNYKQFYRIVNSNHYYDEKGFIIIDNTTIENLTSKRNLATKIAVNPTTLWTPLAPFETFDENGNRKSLHVNVYCLAQSKSNVNVLYCGTETGAIFKSNDKAENWVEVGKTVFNYGSAQAIKIDPNNENIVYVSNDTRLFKSIDGGLNWTLLLSTSQQYDVEVSVNNSNIVYLGGDFGLKRSADGGSTWATIITDKVTDIEFKSNDNTTVFIAKKNKTLNRFEIWKSTNNGLNFSPKISGWYNPTNGVGNHAEAAKLANTAADPNRLYVLLLGNDIDYETDLNYIGIYKSTDGGETWTLPYDGDNNGTADNNPGGPYSATHWAMSSFNVNGGNYDQGFYNAAIDVSDTNPDIFIVGMLNLFKSTDGGTSFKLHGGYGCTNCSNRYRHPDIQGIQVQGADVWVVTDGGVDKYDSNLEFLDSKNKGITTCDLWGFDQGWNEDVVVGGRYHNGNMAYHENYTNGQTLSLGGGESATGFVNLAENKKTYFDDIGGKIIPSTLIGKITATPSLTKYPNVGEAIRKSEIVNDPRWWNHIYLGKDNKLWKSLDYGQTFTLLHEFGTSLNKVRGIEISRKNPNLIFVAHHLGTSVKFWKSADSGITWSEIALPVTTNSFTFSLNEQDELFVSFDKNGNDTNKVFKSTNFGQNWTNLTTSKLNSYVIQDIEVQEGTNGGVYICSQQNVFYKNNSMPDWVNISDGIPSSFRLLDAKPFYKSGKLRLAGNRGVWEREFYENSAPQAQPMLVDKETFCNREVLQFEDYSTLNHTGATWLWNFPGATSVSSTTARNPLVTYSNPGNYNVTLTVTNLYGTSTKTIQNMVVVNPSLCFPKPLAEKAITFDGTNSQRLTKTFSTTKPITNFTFSAWIKPNGIQSNFSSIIFTDGITLDFKNDRNELGTHCGSFWGYNSGLIVPKDKWSYVALIYTPTKVTILLNEKMYEINATFPSLNLSSIDFGIHNRRSDRQYNGLLEEVSLWDRALTLEELRLNRHLTRTTNTDPNLFAYYQFNDIKNGFVYDVKNDNDLVVYNGASIVESTCPIGPGVTQKLTLSQNNTSFDFNTCKIKLKTAATNFNGDVYVTKINTNPYQKPNHELNAEYYIVENYGANANVGVLNTIEFSNIVNIGSLSNSQLKLYQRERNSDVLSEWVDKGNPSSINSTAVNFSNLNVTSAIPLNNNSSSNTLDQTSGQFYIASSLLLLDDDNDSVKNNIDTCANSPAGETVNSFGCAQSQIDSDNDGVMNNVDTCANTPAGQLVNSVGCAQSQLDSDNDGVMNNADTCANTPAGQSVNSVGCAQSQLDSDNDGVMNNVDTCANTPAGETVNSVGCAQSQLDSDNDGVMNNADTCANTPAGETVNSVGCAQSQLDSDNDGVMNNADTCANTPAGETVNSIGCAESQIDSDNDGVMNNTDTCANTPAGETVNSIGCAQSQIDSDNDGVMNNVDTCANTPVGQAVNSAGCAQSQLNNDDDNDGILNNADTCANTPVGQTVNSVGCSQSQLDLDNDGVMNNVDTCANTPAGQSVNSVGCAQSQLDSDNDGVMNNVDTCANTPAGETVNSVGCSQSQIDSDNDGVMNNVDTCANTPAGETVNTTGCAQSQLDSDNDGVMNNVDTCDYTPVGQAVNTAGCSQSQIDSDNDGVINNVDTCANTPAGQAVNTTGCSQSQIDSDNDGVINNVDTCADTPAGETINSTGCAESQLDTDSDGVKNNLDSCPNTPTGEMVDANGCIFIAANNFTVEVIGETCPNMANGKINITAIKNLIYTATVNGRIQPFTGLKLNLTNLPPATYDICIMVTGTNIKQCYTIVVPRSAAITSKIVSNSGKVFVQVQTGTAPYDIIVNNVPQFTTTNSRFDVSVVSGDVLEIRTAKACEGIFAKTITLLDAITAVPNPTTGQFVLYLPITDQNIGIEIYNSQGKVISKSINAIESGKVHLNIEKEAAGVYFVRVLNSIEQTIQIIKK